METIDKVGFTDARIYIITNKNNEYSRPLEAFPRLWEATEQERQDFKINPFKDAIRWEGIDEDIHISSFFATKEPNIDNPIARVFERFPELNISQVAEKMGIHKSLLSQYIYGFKTPSETRKKEIEKTLHSIGEELLSVEV